LLNDGDGWIGVGDMFNTITEGRGLIAYVYSDDEPTDNVDEGFPKVIDSESTVRNDISFDYSSLLTFTSSGDAAADGWNLIGNPYLAAVDWDDFNRSNVNNTVYVYVPGTGGYEEYTVGGGGSGNNPFENDGFIAPFQGFFVQASASSPSVEIADITTAQVNNVTDDPFRKSTQDVASQIRLQIEKDEYKEDVLFLFRDGASRQFDKGDGYELGSPEEQRLSFYSPLDNGEALSINNLPKDFTDERQFPIHPIAKGCVNGSPFGGEITLSWPALMNLPADWGIQLLDTETGEVLDLQDEEITEYTFTLDSQTSAADCSAKSSNADMKGPPAPSVLNHNVSKSGGVNTRFVLTIMPNNALPVEMGSFTGSADGERSAILEWTTLSESNNSGFYVEQKVDGSFQTVSSLIEGAGTTTEQQSYRFRIDDLEVGTTHTFRLRQVDVDGDKSYTEPIDVKLGIQDAYKLEAYPNPVQGGQQAKVRFAVDERQPVTIELYNTLGQRVQTLYNGAPRVVGEFQEVMVNASDLASGVYFVRMRGDSFATTQKLVVVR
jgi:hypothetical protein